MKEFLYRYEEKCYGNGVDQFDNPLPGHYINIELRSYEILKRTKKGVWIRKHYDKRRFVLLTARKKFACETKEDALESLIKRKERQILLLSNKLSVIKDALSIALEMKLKDNLENESILCQNYFTISR